MAEAGKAGGGWRAYYDATADRPPRRTLIEALDRFAASEAPRLAVDLGCGDGRDTIELLRRGWSVVAVDAEPEALARLGARPDLPAGASLMPVCARFEDAPWPMADLVNASFALPLCPPDRFAALWRKIVTFTEDGKHVATVSPYETKLRTPASAGGDGDGSPIS